MFSTSCPECGRDYQLRDDKANKRLKCKDCGQTFVATPAGKKKRSTSTGTTSKNRPQQLPPRAGGGRPKGNRKKAKRTASGRTWPVFVGVGVIAVGGIAMLVFALSGSNSDDIAATDPSGDSVAKESAAVADTNTVVSASDSDRSDAESALNFQSRETAAEGRWRQHAEPREYPSLPDAISALPTWLIETPNAPFDLADYGKMPDPDDNAAPLYLDALYEFSSDVETCFPDSERAQRTPVVRSRQEQLNKLHTRWLENRAAVTLAEVNALLAEYKVGFQKLEAAQRKPECVFQTGVSIAALLPHAQSARSVARAACLRGWSDCQQGNLDAAIQVAEDMFRLGRDINRRGQQISALVATACDRLVCDQILRDVLLHPDLTIQQCDRLLSVVREHAQKSDSRWRRAIQGDYVMARTTVHDLQYRAGFFSPEAIDEFGLDREKLQGNTYGQFAVKLWFDLISGNDAPPDEAGAVVDAMTDDDFANEVRVMNGFYQSVFEALDRPVHELRARWKQIEDRLPTPGRWEISRSYLSTASTIGAVACRERISLNGHFALICIRRWQLEHGQSVPPDLKTALQDVGVTEPLLDAYGTGEPLRLTTIAGQPVVYSLGGDGKDDKGLIDCGYDPNNPGDWTFRLESLEDHNQRFEAAEKS